MAVLYRIQKLVERDSKEISSLWKVFAIILCSTTAVTAMISYIAQGRIYEGFGGVCILESHIKFKEVPDVIRPTKLYNEYDSFFEQGSSYGAEEKNESISISTANRTSKHFQIDIAKSQWGPDDLCQFCQYVPAISVVVGTFWATMFSACPRGGINRRGLRQSWRIVPAAFVFFLTIASFSALASNRLEKYLLAFCTEFSAITNTSSCTGVIDSFTIHFHDDKIHWPVFKWIDTSIVCLWLSTGCWITAAILMLLRFCCLVDFQISITTITNNRPNTSAVNENLQEEKSIRKSLLNKNNQEDD
ncbi:uncharacterized protein LOC113364021 isoform X2 [Ctenocephalides felis]|uniref:uncharacterized protein LOC113364021 isoform X2 n=1 Tax=Ctenocephalides felis TaxID=7515 RepID=UPI000E6E3415|nr:uncharacterized protein LOC113364021 isoform X2 [Ctenocephalides felis]